GTARRRRGRARLAAAALATATALATLTLAPQAAAAPTAPGHEGTQRVLDAAVADGLPGALARARARHGVWNGTAGPAARDPGRAR
ncbi:peptidase, partial [Streptomyces sp. PGLac3x]